MLLLAFPLYDSCPTIAFRTAAMGCCLGHCWVSLSPCLHLLLPLFAGRFGSAFLPCRPDLLIHICCLLARKPSTSNSLNVITRISVISSSIVFCCLGNAGFFVILLIFNTASNQLVTISLCIILNEPYIFIPIIYYQTAYIIRFKIRIVCCNGRL